MKQCFELWLAWLTYPSLIEMWSGNHMYIFSYLGRGLRMPRAVLLGATNVYQMRLYVAHSQLVQLYQMTFVERQKLGIYTQKNKLLNERDLNVAPIMHLIKSSKLELL